MTNDTITTIARQCAEKIVDESLAYMAELDGNPRMSKHAPKSTARVATIIASVLRDSDLVAAVRAEVELASQRKG